MLPLNSLVLLVASVLISSATAKHVVCYYGSWATYRAWPGKYDVSDIDVSKCTHFVYSFAGLDSGTGTVMSLDNYNDLEENWGKGSYKKFTALSQSHPEVKTLLAVGGWNEGSVKYSNMASTSAGRKHFAQSVVSFLQKFGFQGLDLDWEYPTRRGGRPEDRANHVLLLKELSVELKSNNMLLTVAIGASLELLATAYDVAKIAEYVDFINLMSFDYFTSSSSPVTGHAAPLSSSRGISVNESINAILHAGAPRSKIVMGIPFIARTYTLTSEAVNGVGAPTTGPGVAGSITQEAGSLTFYELCMKQEDEKWTVRRTNNGEVYTFSGCQWASYEDERSIAVKTKYIMDNDLGGAMVWSLESDDISGVCQGGKGALLNAVVKEHVVCYYGSWATYRAWPGKYDVSDIDVSKCTHLVYSFAGLESGTGTVMSLDNYNDLEENWGKGSYKKFTALSQSHPEVKTLLAVGGWNEGSVKYSNMASTSAGRKHFAQSVVSFLQKFGFQGLDLDWEYPTRRGGRPEDRANHVLLLKELSIELKSNNMLLTVAIGASLELLATAYDVANIAEYVDFINLMSFDYFTSSSSPFTGHAAPLSSNRGISVNESINAILHAGAPRSKIVLGIPFIARTYTLTSEAVNGVGAPTTGPGVAGLITQEAGSLTFYELCMKQEDEKWTVRRTNNGEVYTFSGRQWASYEDEQSIAVKTKYIMDNDLGGAMVWSLESDDISGVCQGCKGALLNAVVKGLGRT